MLELGLHKPCCSKTQPIPVIQASTCKEFISLISNLKIFEDPENMGEKR